MKTYCTIQLESKEIRAILAHFFEVDVTKVVSTKYGFALSDTDASEAEKKLKTISNKNEV